MARKRSRTRRTRVKAEVVEEPAEVVEEVEEEELDEEEEEALPKKTRRRRRKVEPEPEPEEESQEVTLSDVELAETLFETLLDGDSLTITRTGKKVWVVASGGAVAVSGVGKLSGKAYWDEVESTEFREWREEWRQLTFAEKVRRAEKLKIDWEEHEDPKIEVIRIAAGVREALGIEKYKEDYRTRAARAAVKA